MSKNQYNPLDDPKYMVIDSHFVGEGSATPIAESAGDEPDFDWQGTLALAIAQGRLDQWMEEHPGVDVPDVI